MQPSVTSWTIPSPHGLWYRAIIVIDRGLFLTSDMDVTSLQRITAAAAEGPKQLISEMFDHDRFKKPSFVPLSELTGFRRAASIGMLEIEAGDKVLSARVPNRERLDEVALEVAAALKVVRSAATDAV